MHIRSAPPSFSRRLLRPGWTDVVSLVHEETAPWPEDRVVGLWALVLESRGIPHRLKRRAASEGGGSTILVQSWFVQRAVEEIRLFRAENPFRMHEIPRLQGRVAGGEPLTALLMALLAVFHVATTMAYPWLDLYPSMWLRFGSANAAAILDGQWWRVFTALSLHGDGAHILGNAIIGGVFIMVACHALGVGPGWLLVILSGAAGNLINAYVLGPPHDAIGFSTAVFGATGLLAGSRPFFGKLKQAEGLGFGFRLRRFVRSAFLPVAAGLGLLAMLGSGGENTDLGAHLFGFLAGLMFGVGAGWLESQYGRPGPIADRTLLCAGLAALPLAWIMAFSQ